MVGRIGVSYGRYVLLFVALTIGGSLLLGLGTPNASCNDSFLLQNEEAAQPLPESVGYGEPAQSGLTVLTGTTLWDNVYTLTDGSYGKVVVPLYDGGYALFGDAYTAEKGYDFGMVRVNATGQFVFGTNYGGSEPEHLHDAIRTSTGDFVMVGDTFSFGSGMYDIWVLCVDENGNHLWNSTIGTGMYDYGRSIIEVSTGGFLVLAELEPDLGGGDTLPGLYRLDEEGFQVWYDYYSVDENSYVYVRDLIECDDGGFAFAGRIHYDGWLLRVDSLGNHLWNRTYGYSSNEDLTSILRQDDSGFILAGSTNGMGAGGSDVRMLWTDAEGRYIREQAYGGPTWELCEQAIQLQNGGFALTGQYQFPGPGGSFGALFMRIDDDGTLLLNQHWGEGASSGLGVAEVERGGVAVFGDGRNATEQIHFSLRVIPEVRGLSGPYDIYLQATDSLCLGMYADSAAGIGQWTTNHPYLLAVSNEGVVTSLLPLEAGLIVAYVTAEDTLGNSASAAVWIWVSDYNAPQWVQAPTDQIVELGHEFVYDLNATDPSGPLRWSIDNDTRFTIDSGGIVRSADMLSVGPYSVLVSVRDSYDNTLSAVFVVTVRDTTAPMWTNVPGNQFLSYGEPVQCQLTASDLSGVAYWKISDAVHFAMSPTGLLTSEGILEPGIYPIAVTAVDAYGNEASASLTVYIEAASYTTTTTTTTTTVGQADWGTVLVAGGVGFGAGAIIVSVAYLCLRSRRKDE